MPMGLSEKQTKNKPRMCISWWLNNWYFSQRATVTVCRCMVRRSTAQRLQCMMHVDGVHAKFKVVGTMQLNCVAKGYSIFITSCWNDKARKEFLGLFVYCDNVAKKISSCVLTSILALYPWFRTPSIHSSLFPIPQRRPTPKKVRFSRWIVWVDLCFSVYVLRSCGVNISCTQALTTKCGKGYNSYCNTLLKSCCVNY